MARANFVGQAANAGPAGAPCRTGMRPCHHDRPVPDADRGRPQLRRQAVGVDATLLVRRGAAEARARGLQRQPQGELDRARPARRHHRLERPHRLHLQAHQLLERPLLQRHTGAQRRRILVGARLLGRAGRAVHRRRGLSRLADAAAHHPLAALAEPGLLPRLARRPHLLPHGADAPRRRQPRAAHRAGLQHLRLADA